MRIFGCAIGWFVLTGAMASCPANDARDPGHDCLVADQNGIWLKYNVTMNVTSPQCPVPISAFSQAVSFSSNTTAPLNLSLGGGPEQIEFWNALGDRTNIQFFAFFSPYNATQERAQLNGSYLAATAGDRTAGPVQDFGTVAFPINPVFEFGSASANALLPYRSTLPNLVSAKVLSSNNTHAKAGKLTWVRATPQINETISKASFKWWFDGKAVVDTGRSTDPRYPYYHDDRWLQAKIMSPGTHTWKVDMTYQTGTSGGWPVFSTVSTTWNQTWY